MVYNLTMDVHSLSIPDIKIIKSKKLGDERGYFTELYTKKNFDENVDAINFVQDNQSLSVEKNVVRGLHFQSPPFAQDKLVRCISGSILDVAVDIRKTSKYFGKHIAKVISAQNFEQILVPKGFAHGFVTLEENTVINYKVSNYYSAENDHGLYWADPELMIEWGIDEKVAILSEKDSNQPLLKDLITPF